MAQAEVQKCIGSLTLQSIVDWKQEGTAAQHSGSPVVCLEHNNTVAHALKVLAKHKILSAPLVMSPGLEDMEGEGIGAEPSGPTLLGWIDIADILRGLLHHLHQKHPRLPSSMLQLMTELEHEGKAFTSRTLVSLSGGDDKSLVYEGEAAAPLLDTLRSFYLNNAGVPGRVVHRLALFDAHGQISHVISQLDLIRYLTAHIHMLGPAAESSVESLGLVQRVSPGAAMGLASPPTSPTSTGPLARPSVNGHGVVCVEPHVPTLLALERISAAGVSAAAVVAPLGGGVSSGAGPAPGQMVANLSISDLRCIQPDHLSVLALPVAEFLALLHNTSYLGYSQRGSAQAEHPFFASGPRTAAPPVVDPDAPQEEGGDDAVRLITCRPTAPLRDVLRLLGDNGVHRVYVIDPAAKPQVVAVITPTDILRWVSNPVA